MNERCSYCHDGTERDNPVGQHEIGCPRRACPKCGRQYFDTAYEENALYAYHLKPTMPDFIHPLLVSLVIVLPLNILSLQKMLQGQSMPLALLFPLWLSSIYILGRTCWVLYPWIFRKRYHRKYEESKIPIFNGTEYISDEFSQSLQRMSSVDYLYYLISHGVEVPEFFFRRIGQTVDAARVEDLKAVRREFYERRTRKERLQKLRDELTYYEECLSMEPTSSEFSMLAKAGGLPPRTFRARCETQAAQLRQTLKKLEQAEE